MAFSWDKIVFFWNEVDVRMSGGSKHSFYCDLQKSRIESVPTNFHCNVSEEPAL